MTSKRVESLRPVSAQHQLPHPGALAAFWTPHIWLGEGRGEAGEDQG